MCKDPKTRNVKIIPATINPSTKMKMDSTAKRRVAGYGRVSTDRDEQFNSFEAQVDYYTKLIQNNPEWEFVRVYTDEGISGTNTKKRDGFNEMISDALAGKIDLIITKSISRFARNTVDSLLTIRKLKEAGCECYFEKENIYTFDSKGELFLTIMASIAQEESRSISENISWGIRKRFSDGKVSLAYSYFLGYQKGPDVNHPLTIVSDEAKTVRRIYSDFISGHTPFMIAQTLTSENIPTPAGKNVWNTSTVDSILKNEKYRGAALLQKRFTTDFLSKTSKKNEGELPQYYIDKSHEPIIGLNEWRLVQKEIERRKKLKGRYSGIYVFSSRLVCGCCGNYYGTKLWNSTDKYRRTVWQCNGKYVGKTLCSSPHLNEADIQKRFIYVFNIKYSIRKQLLADCRLIVSRIANTEQIETLMNALKNEMDKLKSLLTIVAKDNDSRSSNCMETQYNEYTERYYTICKKLEETDKQRIALIKKRRTLKRALQEIMKRENPIQTFDNLLWIAAINKVIVKSNGILVFEFHDGEIIEN